MYVTNLATPISSLKPLICLAASLLELHLEAVLFRNLRVLGSILAGELFRRRRITGSLLEFTTTCSPKVEVDAPNDQDIFFVPSSHDASQLMRREEKNGKKNNKKKDKFFEDSSKISEEKNQPSKIFEESPKEKFNLRRFSKVKFFEDSSKALRRI